jgi:hypothetical protein
MSTPSWSTFLTNHPDRENLTNLARRIFIAPTVPTISNTHNLQSYPSTLFITLDPFTHVITPHFYHYQLGLPILGQTTKLIALQDFFTIAIPIELVDNTNIFTQTKNTISTPTMNAFLSFHDKNSDQLKAITTLTATETHYICKKEVLPPAMIVLLIACLSGNHHHTPHRI